MRNVVGQVTKKWLVLMAINKCQGMFGQVIGDVAARLRDLESGSIGPKVQASISFIRNGGNEAIVCSLQHLSDALAGISGTHFFR